jgi:biopolymer transport protein TolR
MSVSVSTGGKSGRKSVSADLNLVPYIDLLTCMVSFLLITAAWTQLARLQANQKGQGQAGEETPPTQPLNIVVVVTQESFNLVVGTDQVPIPKRGDQYDFGKLGAELKKVKEAHPEKNDVKVASEDQIKYDVLIRSMDAAYSAGFPDLSLVDSGAAGI